MKVMVVRTLHTTYASPLSSTISHTAKKDENSEAKGTHPFGHVICWHIFRLSFDDAVEQSDRVHVVRCW
jgi:hypothetical protein